MKGGKSHPREECVEAGEGHKKTSISRLRPEALESARREIETNERACAVSPRHSADPKQSASLMEALLDRSKGPPDQDS